MKWQNLSFDFVATILVLSASAERPKYYMLFWLLDAVSRDPKTRYITFPDETYRVIKAVINIASFLFFLHWKINANTFIDIYRKQKVITIQVKYVHYANHAHYACIWKLYETGISKFARPLCSTVLSRGPYNL